jgi:hypothetical protein
MKPLCVTVGVSFLFEILADIQNFVGFGTY